MSQFKKLDWLIVGLISFGYYLLLSAKGFTWIFASQDAGDWLAGSTVWMNVQPFGSPLYILLGHFLHWILPQHLILAMTVGLSVLPASICVATVYLTVKKLASLKYALISALVLLGSAVFLSQSTILEEYAISAMFVSLAFYFYICGRKKFTILMLALGSAVHVIVALISVIWLIINIRDLKSWYQTFWIYFVFGILPYSMVFILMAMDTPKLLAGNLSWQGINNYLGSSGTIGSLSLFETPKRLLQFGMVVSVSLLFAILPLIYSFKGLIHAQKYVLVGFATIMFTLWLYLTDTDPSTWTFMTFSMPIIAIFAGLGLSKLGRFHARIVTLGAIALILVNAFCLNANLLTQKYPFAQQYEQDVKALPSGSYLICNSGGQYGLANYYFMAQGYDIRPVYYGMIADLSELTPQGRDNYIEYLKTYFKTVHHVKDNLIDAQIELLTSDSQKAGQSPRYQSYLEWSKDKFGTQGHNTLSMVKWMLENDKPIYIVKPTITPYWENIFILEYVNNNVSKVVGINENFSK